MMYEVAVCCGLLCWVCVGCAVCVVCCGWPRLVVVVIVCELVSLLECFAVVYVCGCL